jgi:putative hemolysin
MAITIRDYSVRLTKNKEERKMVRQLRYRVFVEEDGLIPNAEQKLLREEYDSWDAHADYMAIFHEGKVIGCYRIITREAAEKMGGFYSEIEFDISKIKRARGNIAEMSRACIAPEYRNSALAISLMWLGLGEYIVKNKIAVLFGMASWFNVKPYQYAMATSYLYYNHMAPPSLRARVDYDKLPDGITPRMTKMNIIPRDFVDQSEAYNQMPAVLKGYLRLGAQVGVGMGIDNDQFPSHSVFVVMQTKNISKVYQKRFAGDENACDSFVLEPSTYIKFERIMLLPITGSWKLLKIMGQMLLPPDAGEAEYKKDE